jgi:hypothetical protein
MINANENAAEELEMYAEASGTDLEDIAPCEYVPVPEDYPTVEEYEEAMREHIAIENRRAAS